MEEEQQIISNITLESLHIENQKYSHTSFWNTDNIRTHIDYDVERVIIGQKDTNTAAVLHGFVIVEVQFVHLRVAGTGQAPLPATGALGPPMTRLHHCRRRQHQSCCPQLHPRAETLGPMGSAGQAALTGQGMGTWAAVSHCGNTQSGHQHEDTWWHKNRIYNLETTIFPG